MRGWIPAAAGMIAFTAVAVGCADVLGTREPRQARITFVGRFQVVPATTQVGDSVTMGRIIVSRTGPGATRVITNASMDLSNTNNDNDTIPVVTTFPIQGPGVSYEVVVKAVGVSGDTLFQLGPLAFTASQISARGDVTLYAKESDIAYVGPGSDAVKVVALTKNITLSGNQSHQIVAQAYGPNNVLLPRAFFDYFVVTGPNLVGIDRDSVFNFGNRGTAKVLVVAQGKALPSDTVTVVCYPNPFQTFLESGGGQQATAGTRLPNPIVVRLLAADFMGAPNITVQFSGPGQLSPTSVVSGGGGLAQTLWTLGPALGTQTLTVTVPGYNVPPLQIQATAK